MYVYDDSRLFKVDTDICCNMTFIVHMHVLFGIPFMFTGGGHGSRDLCVCWYVMKHVYLK